MGIFKSWINQPIGSTKDMVTKKFTGYVIIEAVKVDVNEVKTTPMLDKNGFPDECWCIFYANEVK
jgi:hypothetical protein